jgi:hypothetical protein
MDPSADAWHVARMHGSPLPQWFANAERIG